jgi:hypothetical protein
MIRFEGRSWRSELQRLLDREAAATMEVCSGEECLQATAQDAAKSSSLNFGPYGTSPISGLHFDAAQDTAAS